MPLARRFDGAGAFRGRAERRQGRGRWQVCARSFTSRKPRLCHSTRRLRVVSAMPTTTTTPQFGRRGAAPPPRDPPRPGARPPADAASAFEAATRWNRSASTSEPSMSAIFAPLPDQDEWVPKSGLGAPTDVAPPPSDLAAKLFSFDGRIRRRDFWLMSFLCSGATLVAALVCLFALPQPMNVALVFCLGFVSA